MTSSKAFALLVGSASLLGATAAHAEDAGKGFGEDGQVILSADRLFGLSFTSVKTEQGGGGGTTTVSDTTVSLLWANGTTPYQIPRAAIDVVVASGITVGGSIGFVTSSGTSKSEPPGGGANIERDSPTITVFALAPRVGYALALTDQIAFWPRVGITYLSSKAEFTSGGTPSTTSKTTTSGLGLDLEPMFVFSPTSHFGITAGPVLDLPLSGSRSSEVTPNPTGISNPDDKVKYMSFGVTVGLLGYF